MSAISVHLADVNPSDEKETPITVDFTVPDSDIAFGSDNGNGNGNGEFSLWNIAASSGINLVLPFINGMMLGFGEIVAHEIGFKYGWYGAKVEPQARMEARAPLVKSKWL